MGPLVSERHRAKVAGFVDAGVAEGAELVSTAAASRRRPRGRPLPRPDALRRRQARDADLRPGDLRPGARRRARRHYPEALALVNASPFGNGAAIFTNDGGAAARFRAGRHGRHGRRQRADPGADGLPLVRRLEGVAVRRPARARPRRRALLHARQGRHAALAGPGPHRASISGSRDRTWVQARSARKRRGRGLAPSAAVCIRRRKGTASELVGAGILALQTARAAHWRSSARSRSTSTQNHTAEHSSPTGSRPCTRSRPSRELSSSSLASTCNMIRDSLIHHPSCSQSRSLPRSIDLEQLQHVLQQFPRPTPRNPDLGGRIVAVNARVSDRQPQHH